ncbi:GPI-inositol-deacylase [Trametes coccinea BRFM310]|uniref:GPI inositol-deacylase n=1 Tax=Trametes coccinea (strain BRFM310) TaxID=1353009 RepID=A0A1Y2ITV4_TRAC3|nr:GPI-inositol-deacylase [Trametes coccinea BRFM310]
MSRLLAVFASFAAAAVLVLYYAGLDTLHSLSPQGCRMSWMWPTYLLQTGFDHSWTPLARRYSLWLYREGNLESNLLHGSPVLFIPGNAGSSHQVRSIASSAANQYFSAPYQVSPEFENRGYTGLDFFAVEFNEDLSAFHGPTLDSETAYASRAIDYILSLYPQNTSVIVMGHSMGGVVATALLPHPNVSAIITMSTPHTLPPVRFDRRIDHIYASNLKTLALDPTPILSLCGGATDLMIPSESCILPSLGGDTSSVYRRTVFTSALEGCWTGVGHLAMVWCHQVRWRIARAALEIAAAPSLESRATVMDKWLRDGHTLPSEPLPSDVMQLRPGDYDLVPQHRSFAVRDPVGSHIYTISPPASDDGVDTVRFVLYASQGSVPPIAPHRPLPFRTVVYICPESDSDPVACFALPPSTLKLIPNPVPGAPFPVPDEGTDESEGVVLYEAELVPTARSRVAVKIEGGDGHGWVFGQFVPNAAVVVEVGLKSLVLSSVRISVPSGIRTEIYLPSLSANALLVYQLTPEYHPDAACSADSLLLPLLTHRTHPSETHYYPLTPSFSRRILLHSHASGPYIASDHPVGHTLTIHSSGECRVSAIELSVDWWATIGRWGSRYATAAACWAVGIVAIVLWDVWGLVEGGALVPDVRSSLEFFARRRMPWLVALAYVVSLLPSRAGVWLGNRGDPMFAALAVLLLPIAFGLVCVSWWLLMALMWPLKSVLRRFGRRRADFAARGPLATLASMGLIFFVIFILVPWQVAFLGCWLIHVYTCAASLADLSHQQGQRSLEPEAVPLVRLMPSAEAAPDERETRQAATAHTALLQQANVHSHILLFTTWLLPLVAPVLAVWVRTLATAGFTTPFDGDHNFLYVAPFLVLVEALSGADADRYVKALFERRDKVSPRWGFAGLAGVAFLMGPRTTYLVFETASAAMGWVVVSRIGPLYWAGRSASRRGL